MRQPPCSFSYLTACRPICARGEGGGGWGGTSTGRRATPTTRYVMWALYSATCSIVDKSTTATTQRADMQTDKTEKRPHKQDRETPHFTEADKKKNIHTRSRDLLILLSYFYTYLSAVLDVEERGSFFSLNYQGIASNHQTSSRVLRARAKPTKHEPC